jgi:tetratricopeptide (TPR) repeat protein
MFSQLSSIFRRVSRVLFFFGFVGLLWAQEEEKIEAPRWAPGYRIRYPLYVIGESGVFTNKYVSVLARLPTGGWLRPDGGDVVVQDVSGNLLQTSVLSHHTTGDTIIQFRRNGNQRYYWAYAGSPSAPGAGAAPFAPEGLVAEFRDWKGDVIDSWSSVVGGLKKSDIVIGNAIVNQITQDRNPGRPDNPRNFATSYRGFLSITNAATYQFYVNADDATFLFIDGYKVFEHTGSNLHHTRGSSINTNEWQMVELAAGPHPMELHGVCGNNPSAQGYCSLMWKPLGGKGAAFYPAGGYGQSLLADVWGVQDQSGGQIATFAYGVDDTLSSEGVTLYLVRFEAQGTIPNPNALQWNLGDGTTATGRTVTHIYFKPGEYKVWLKSSPTLSPFTKTIYVCTGTSPTSPESLSSATKILSTVNWTGWDTQQLNTIFDFLLICEQTDRWPIMEKLASHLLQQPNSDSQRRVIYYTALMQALAEQGRGSEAIKLMDKALNEVVKLPSLQVEILLKAADIYWRNLRDFKEASRLYNKIISEHRGLGTPLIRQAAIHWGDLYLEADQVPEAEKCYRQAQTLGGKKFESTDTMDAIKTGALLRVAEQKLRDGNVRESRRLLEQIEVERPEQKLQGLYRFLRAEADRYAGRYEDAIRNYEVLIKLSQWAGFRDRAFFGIADCHYRMEHFKTALQWLDSLKESYPDYYKQAQVEDYRKAINSRIARIESAREEKSGSREDVTDIGFKGFVTGFEPEENQNPGRPERFKFYPMMGIMGPGVGLVQALPTLNNYSYYKRLRNIMVNGIYWIEFWYREQLGFKYQSGSGITPTFTIALVGAGNVSNPEEGTSLVAIDRTYGQWRKVGAKLKAPVTQDGLLRIDLMHVYGELQIDGLKILPVSDRKNDALRSFIEGTGGGAGGE